MFYIVICMCCTWCVYNLLTSLYDTTRIACSGCCITLYIVYTTQLSPALRPKKGDPNGPFFYSAAGHVISSTGPRAAILHIVHSTWRHSTVARLFDQKRGPERSPSILLTLRGFLYFDLVKKNKSGSPFYLWTQGPPVNICKYLPTTTCG